MAVDPKLFRQILSAAGAPTAAGAAGATPASAPEPIAAPKTVAAEAKRPAFGQRALSAARTVGKVSGGVQLASGVAQAGAAAAGAPIPASEIVRNTAIGGASLVAPGLGFVANLLTPFLDSLTEAGLRGVGAIKENKLLTPEFAEEVRAAGGAEAYTRKTRAKPNAVPAAPAAPAAAAPAPTQEKPRRVAPKLGTKGDIFTNLVQFTRDFGDLAISEAGDRQNFRRDLAGKELELRSAQAIASLLAAMKQTSQQKIIEGLSPEESLVVDPATAVARRLRFAAPAVRGNDGQIYIVQNDGSRRLATPTEVRQLGSN